MKMAVVYLKKKMSHFLFFLEIVLFLVFHESLDIDLRGLSPKFVDKACRIVIRRNKIMCVYGLGGKAFNVNCAKLHRF